VSARGRWWFAVTAVAVFAGVVIQVEVAANATARFFDRPIERALNVFAFFTIQSNLIVGVTSLLLALNPDRRSTVFRVARLTGLVAITITFIVFHVALAHLFEFERWALVADRILHGIVPILAVVGWLMYGPRGHTSRRILWWSLAFPVAWCAFTLIRGALIGWYPYPFIDVERLGYARVAVNCVWIAVLYLGVAAGFTTLDGWLIRISDRTEGSDRTAAS
jgi:hypothetical protein